MDSKNVYAQMPMGHTDEELAMRRKLEGLAEKTGRKVVEGPAPLESYTGTYNDIMDRMEGELTTQVRQEPVVSDSAAARRPGENRKTHRRRLKKLGLL